MCQKTASQLISTIPKILSITKEGGDGKRGEGVIYSN
jgi:hypothetical protein